MVGELQTKHTIAFRWHWNGKSLIFALVFLPLTTGLGFWQWHRAEEKSAILRAQEAKLGAEPVDFISVVDKKSEEQLFTVVWFEPNSERDIDNSRTFLLDNRVRRGRMGYEVLTPISFGSGAGQQWLLVNRGWLPAGLDRSQLPSIPPLRGTLTGYLYRSPGEAIVLKRESWSQNQWPLVIQAIDLDKVSAHLDAPVHPFVLRLQGDRHSALEAHWQVVNVMPEKHIGYAVQWFLMAVALVVLTVYANSNLLAVWRSRRQRDE
ncbi:MAG TPA: hypothetical protein DCZ13_02845 [Porticoccaceae bacterium]|nr:hypothetical protein [Porticoccaceae bacterium]